MYKAQDHVIRWWTAVFGNPCNTCAAMVSNTLCKTITVVYSSAMLKGNEYLQV